MDGAAAGLLAGLLVLAGLLAAFVSVKRRAPTLYNRGDPGLGAVKRAVALSLRGENNYLQSPILNLAALVVNGLGPASRGSVCGRVVNVGSVRERLADHRH